MRALFVAIGVAGCLAAGQQSDQDVDAPTAYAEFARARASLRRLVADDFFSVSRFLGKTNGDFASFPFLEYDAVKSTEVVCQTDSIAVLRVLIEEATESGSPRTKPVLSILRRRSKETWRVAGEEEVPVDISAQLLDAPSPVLPDEEVLKTSFSSFAAEHDLGLSTPRPRDGLVVKITKEGRRLAPADADGETARWTGWVNFFETLQQRGDLVLATVHWTEMLMTGRPRVGGNDGIDGRRMVVAFRRASDNSWVVCAVVPYGR